MKDNVAIETSSIIGAASVKALGVKASLGMAGAAVLYLLMPPERPDGTFNRHEFAGRLAVAGLCSMLLGDWAVDVISGLAPWLMAAKHPAPFWLAAGAPGWWVSRAAALWLYNRKGKDLGQIVHDAKEIGT